MALADLTLGVPLGLERLSKDSGDGEIIGNARAEPSQPEHEGDACFLRDVRADFAVPWQGRVEFTHSELILRSKNMRRMCTCVHMISMGTSTNLARAVYRCMHICIYIYMGEHTHGRMRPWAGLNTCGCHLCNMTDKTLAFPNTHRHPRLHPRAYIYTYTYTHTYTYIHIYSIARINHVESRDLPQERLASVHPWSTSQTPFSPSADNTQTRNCSQHR